MWNYKCPPKKVNSNKLSDKRGKELLNNYKLSDKWVKNYWITTNCLTDGERISKFQQTGWLLLESWLNSNKRYDCFQKLLNSNKLYDFYFKDDYIPTKCVTFSFKITKFQQTVTFLAKITRFRQTVRLLLLKLLNFNKLCDFFQTND